MIIDPQNLTAFAAVIAFLAGLVSFLSPCVLPLVPAFIGYLSGAAITPEGVVVNRRQTFLHALAFVMGFSLIFVLLGASASAIGYLLQDSVTLLVRVGGVLLVVFGLRVAGVHAAVSRWAAAAALAGLATYAFTLGPVEHRAIQGVMLALVTLAGAEVSLPSHVALGLGTAALNFLISPSQDLVKLVESALLILVVVVVSRTDLFYAERRIELGESVRHRGYWTSGLMGLVFGAGWTPCVGPNLGIIFTLAGASQTVALGAALLAVYSIGLGVPFLLVGLAFGAATAYLRRMTRYLPVIALVNAALLVFMGILLLSDRLAFLATYGTFVDFGL